MHFVYCRGELYPCETDQRLADELQTGGDSRLVDEVDKMHHCVVAHHQLDVDTERCLAGQEVEVDMENDTLVDVQSGKTFHLKPLGEVGHAYKLTSLGSNVILDVQLQ